MKSLKEKMPQVRLVGDKKLRVKAEPVEKFDENLKDLIEYLKKSMYYFLGLGLAAPQIGISKRIFVIDQSWDGENDETKDPLVFINPVLSDFEGDESFEEGCLSLPNIFANVVRPEKVKIVAFDENGDKFEINADDILARAIQHENDHLNGTLFIDRVPNLKLISLKRKIKKLERQTNDKGENIKRKN